MAWQDAGWRPAGDPGRNGDPMATLSATRILPAMWMLAVPFPSAPSPDRERMNASSDPHNRPPARCSLCGQGPGAPSCSPAREPASWLRPIPWCSIIWWARACWTCCKPEAERIYVGKEPGHHELPQPEINRLLIDRARAGPLRGAPERRRSLRVRGAAAEEIIDLVARACRSKWFPASRPPARRPLMRGSR